MNQYIIDEEMITSWRNGCVNLLNSHTDDDICKKCKYRGKGLRENCCNFDDNSMEDIFRSRPYNPKAERDEVLNEAIEFMKNKIRLPTNSGEHLSYEADIRFKVISEVKKELRQMSNDV